MVMATFIRSILVLIRETLYWLPEPVNGSDIGVARSVFAIKAVADVSVRSGRFCGQEDYDRRFG